MYLFSALQGQATSSSPSASGAPTECTQGTNSPSSPSTSSVFAPTRVMIIMFTATQAESVSSTPMCAIGEPSGPIENGTTYIVRPAMQPSNRPLSLLAHLGRVGPVVRRAGALRRLGADERAVLDPRDVAGIRAREEASSGAWRQPAS